MIDAIVTGAGAVFIGTCIISLRFGLQRIASEIKAASQSSRLSELSSAWNEQSMLSSRLVVADILKTAPWESENLKNWLKEQDRFGDWQHIALIAQFIRRVANSFENGGVSQRSAIVEFRGLAWWASRLGVVYGKFPEEQSISGMMMKLTRRINDE